jgi:hypothetical protein
MATQIKEVISDELQNLLKNFLLREENKYYTYYVGKVVDVNDPEKIGRVRVRVYGIYEDTIPDDDLPWAIQEPSFLGSTLGNFIVPPVDTIVNVRFSHGNIYEPIYCSKAIVKSKMPTDKDIDYPNNLIFFETDQGDSFSINVSTKETKYKTASGDEILVDGSGNITINTTDATVGNLTVNVKGDYKVNADGSISFRSPTITAENDLGASVTPNALGGPFCALNLCLYAGTMHQGKTVTNNLIPGI